MALSDLEAVPVVAGPGVVVTELLGALVAILGVLLLAKVLSKVLIAVGVLAVWLMRRRFWKLGIRW